MKKRIWSSILLSSAILGFALSAQNTPAVPLNATVSPYQTIIANGAVNYVAKINQATRNDGLFSSGPYQTSATTQKPNAQAKRYNGQFVTVTAQATTAHATWAKITMNNGQQFWIDLRGLQKVALRPVTSRQTASGVGILAQTKRNDGLFTAGPYATSSQTMAPAADAKRYNGQTVDIIGSAQTGATIWLQIRLTNGATYWIDASGVNQLKVDPILSQQSVSEAATINQSTRNDGLFQAGPYNTSAASLKPSANAKNFDRQGVNVIAVAKTARATWKQIKLLNGATYWVDARALQSLTLRPVAEQHAVNQYAIITEGARHDGLFTGGPYLSSIGVTRAAGDAHTYNGQGVHVLATAVSNGVQWAEIQLNNGSRYWVDARALRMFTLAPITSKQALNARAIVTQKNREDGLFINGPYQSSTTTIRADGNAKSLNGQVVEVKAQAQTARGTWKQIKTNTGKTYWIDARGLVATNYYMITNKQSSNRKAQISQGSRNDGLFANGPYNTSSTTQKPNANARTYNNQTVTVIQTAQTESASWVRVRLSNGKTYWLDARGITNVVFHDWTKPSQSYAYPNVSNYSGINMEVNLSKQEVYIKRNNQVLYTMYCSSGKNGATPTGHYQIQAERGNVFWEGNIGARWYTSWKGHGIYLFHSVLIDHHYNYIPSESKWLGIKPISHGCIRMSGPDAKWINEHMKVGTKLYIHY